MKQTDLCAGGTVSASHLRNIRLGTQQPSTKMLARIADRLGVEVWDLLACQYGMDMEAASVRVAAVRRDEPSRLLLAGLPSLDRLTARLKRGNLLVLHGVEGSGKSSLAVQWAVHTALRRRDAAVILFGPPNSASAATLRMLALEASIPVETLEAGRLSRYEVGSFFRAARTCLDVNIMVVELAEVSRGRLTRLTRTLGRQGGRTVLVIDSIDAMLGKMGALELLDWLRWRASDHDCVIAGVLDVDGRESSRMDGNAAPREWLRHCDMVLRLEVRPGLGAVATRPRRIVVEDESGFGRFVDVAFDRHTLMFRD